MRGVPFSERELRSLKAAVCQPLAASLVLPLDLWQCDERPDSTVESQSLKSHPGPWAAVSLLFPQPSPESVTSEGHAQVLTCVRGA